jgi:hypothetical protein
MKMVGVSSTHTQVMTALGQGSRKNGGRGRGKAAISDKNIKSKQELKRDVLEYLAHKDADEVREGDGWGGGMGGRERESGGREREGGRGNGRVGGRGRENVHIPRLFPSPHTQTHTVHTQVDRILQRQKEKKDKRIARLKKLGDFMLVDS